MLPKNIKFLCVCPIIMYALSGNWEKTFTHIIHGCIVNTIQTSFSFQHHTDVHKISTALTANNFILRTFIYCCTEIFYIKRGQTFSIIFCMNERKERVEKFVNKSPQPRVEKNFFFFGFFY